LGFKFRRQQALGRFIVDFYCREAKLVIEVDGPVHDHQPEKDSVRQATLEQLGLRVLRFSNDEIHTSMEKVLAAIAAQLPAN
jgi:very-short-patch-repair endonuclease